MDAYPSFYFPRSLAEGEVGPKQSRSRAARQARTARSGGLVGDILESRRQAEGYGSSSVRNWFNKSTSSLLSRNAFSASKVCSIVHSPVGVSLPPPLQDPVDLLPVITIPGHNGLDQLHREMGEIFYHALDVTVVELNIGDDIVNRGPGPGQGRVPAAPLRVTFNLDHWRRRDLHVGLPLRSDRRDSFGDVPYL
jgi:hypothetical protein